VKQWIGKLRVLLVEIFSFLANLFIPNMDQPADQNTKDWNQYDVLHISLGVLITQFWMWWWILNDKNKDD